MKDNVKPSYKSFVEHYCLHSNATQAYLFAYPGVKYSTAGTNGHRLLEREDIQELIEETLEKDRLIFAQSKDRTIRELYESAEEAKEAGQFNAYGKLRDMIIKILGYYDPVKYDIKQTEWRIDFDGGEEAEEDTEEGSEEGGSD